MNFPVNEKKQASLADRGIEVISVTTENIRQFSNVRKTAAKAVESSPPGAAGSYAYRVGVGDQLRVQTWATPERQMTVETPTALDGPIVEESGEFFYPYVGMVKADGKTITEIRDALRRSLSTYIADPQVEVDIQEFNAHSVTLVGAIAKPGSTPITNIPLRLLDLINASGKIEESDLKRVKIRRRGNEYSVNLKSFMDYGTVGQNPILLPDDIVFVPAMNDNKVFVFGQIGAGEVPLGAAGLTLTDVLAERGGLDRRANARGIFVFRQRPGETEGFNVFQFDLSDASALMLTSQFPMVQMDVVFITTDPIARWNEAIVRILSPVTGIVATAAIADQIKN